MARKTEEWVGKTDDEAIPARVKLRIFEKFNGHCACCTNKIIGKLKPAYDHIVALINGGENRESNLQLLCTECHKVKTAGDVAEKSRAYGARLKAVGIKAKSKSKPMPGSRASGFKRKIGGGVVRR